MASTFTPNIQLEEPARNDDVGVWDTPVNNNMTLVDLVVGAIASALSSTLTTPLDVVKTRLATGRIAAGTPILASLRAIAKADGVSGLFVGLQERVLLSGLFGGVGLAAFERAKAFLERDDVSTREGTRRF